MAKVLVKKEPPPKKQCLKCKHWLPLASFGKDKHNPDGLTYRCKPCRNQAGKEWRDRDDNQKVRNDKNKSYRVWYYQQPDVKRRNRNQYLLFKYGITLDEYERMYNEQNGKCYLCGNVETSKDNFSKEVKLLSVDHCHDTGMVRNLLCAACNSGIGHLRENPELIEKAAQYVRDWKEKHNVS